MFWAYLPWEFHKKEVISKINNMKKKKKKKKKINNMIRPPIQNECSKDNNKFNK